MEVRRVVKLDGKNVKGTNSNWILYTFK